MFFVYIIRSLKDNGFYVGLTSNITKRIKAHNAGSTKSTKSRRPFILVHKEVFSTRQKAREREKYLKSYKGSSEKLKILESL